MQLVVVALEDDSSVPQAANRPAPVTAPRSVLRSTVRRGVVEGSSKLIAWPFQVVTWAGSGSVVRT